MRRHARLLRACAVLSAVLSAALSGVPRASAQVRADTARCDSVLVAARIDSVPAKLFVSAARLDGPDLGPVRLDKLLSYVIAGFLPPVPFRLSVFAGGARMQTLRPHDVDRADAQAPVVAGRYRVYARHGGDSLHLALVRASLVPGFDEAAEEAILSTRGSGAFAPPPDADSMIVDVRLGTDSSAGARKFVEAYFPRMPVVDAVPELDNPKPEFPDDARADSVTAGEVVFAFVVDRSGSPAMETVEVLRATSMSFVRAALRALPAQRFRPATVHGCPVAQQIEYPMGFALRPAAPVGVREPVGAPARPRH